jgi:Mor family transcriptional regulator
MSTDKNKKRLPQKGAKENNAVLDKLPGDLRRVAELIGLPHAMLLVEHFGGGYIIVPKCDEIKKEIRDNEIRALYDAGGVTIRDLAYKYELTTRTINTVLGKDNEEVPLPLFDLMQKSQ